MADSCGDDEILGHYSVEERLSEYADMIAPDWCRNFSSALPHRTEINEAGNDLMVQWRAATRVAELPAVMMSMFSEFASRTLRNEPALTMLPMLADAWGAAFRSHSPQLAKGTRFTRAMQATIEAVDNKLDAAIRESLAMVSTDNIGRAYLAENDFRFRIWSAMQVCAVAVYNAYDGFLARCTDGEAGRLADRLKSRYGPEMYEQLFQPRDIQIARELRHAVSHNRGRVTEKLQKLKPGLACHEGLISIYPRDIRQYLTAMGGAAITLARHVPAP